MTIGRKAPHPIRVIIADDDDAVRSALVDVLAADSRFEVAGSTAHVIGLPALVASTRPDLVLLDVRMPSGGPDAVALVRAAAFPVGGTSPAVVAISADTGTATVAAMVRAGVVGYLAKGQDGGSVPDLLARCAGGEVVLAVPSGADALRDAAAGAITW